MPSRERVASLIKRVEEGRFVEALQEFYTEDATMQENGQPPRVGREALVANERQVLAAFDKTRARCVQPVFTSGDQVVIRWLFEFSTASGATIRLEELALQRWQGDRIAEERFYYDPIQMTP